MTKIPPDDILEGLYKLRLRESEKLKTVFELYNMEIHLKKVGPDNHRLKTMVKRSTEQDIRNKNFGARNGNYETNAAVKNRGQNSVNKEFLETSGNGKPTGSVWKETIVVSVTISINVKLLSRIREMLREPVDPEARVPVVECLDGHARITSKELAPILSVKSGILQNACSTSPRMDADLVKSALARTARLTNSLARSVRRMMTKVQLPCWKVHDNWVVFSRTWRRRSLFSGSAPTCGNQSNVWNLQRVLRVTLKFETKIHRSEWFAQVNHISVTPTPKNLRIGLRRTEWQEQGAREAAWKLAKSVFKLKEHERATFFSPSDNRWLPASTLHPEETEFVVYSGASMLVISKKDEWSWNGYFDEVV